MTKTKKMFFDKNEERIKELQRKPPDSSIDKKIEALRAKGAEWWAYYHDSNNMRRREKPKENTKEAAETLARERMIDIDRGDYNPPDKFNVPISTITRFFLEMKNHSGDTRTICKRINEYIGTKTLKALHLDRTILVKHFKNFPDKAWSDKTKWNYFVKLRAAISLWIEFHSLTIPNPAKLVPSITGMRANVRVREQTPTDEQFRNLIVTCIEVGAPQEIIDLFTVVRLSGLRIREILSWKIEDLGLSLTRDDSGTVIEVPYFTTKILKQSQLKIVQIPMRAELWSVLKTMVGDRTAGDLWPWRNPPYGVIEYYKIMEKSGMKDFRPFHDYRKTFKTELHLAGFGSDYTMFLQGHQSESMDRYYTQFKRRDVQRAYVNEYK